MWKYDRKIIKFIHQSELLQTLNELGVNDWEIIYYTEINSDKYLGENISIILIKKELIE